MLTIFSDMFKTASRADRWDAPPHWTRHGRPLSAAEARRIEAERQREQLARVWRW